MDSKNGIDLVLWCGVGGLYFESFYEKDIATFVEKCAEAGVKRLIPSFYISPVKSHRWLIRHLEVEAAYEPYEYGEKSPLNVLVRHAHDCGLEVHPHVPLGSEGGWMRVSSVGELGVFARMSKFARDHPEYWTKTNFITSNGFPLLSAIRLPRSVRAAKMGGNQKLTLRNRHSRLY